jgi:hypothetical protein
MGEPSMRLLTILLFIGSISLSTGCSMCARGYLDDYATVGGKWQRTNPTSGRVGSLFSDAGTTLAGGAVGNRVIDASPQGIEGQMFGEAYTEDYSGSVEEFHEIETVPYESQPYDSPQGDAPLMLGDDW